jgi:hypothetical protein
MRLVAKVSASDTPAPISKPVKQAAKAEFVNFARQPAEPVELAPVMSKDHFLEAIQRLQREQSRTSVPIHRHQPRVRGMQSPRMRAVNSQTNNLVRASLGNDFIKTPIRKSPEGLTLNIGPGCGTTWGHGKEVQSR